MLPREPGDRQEAETLSRILPVLLKNDRFRRTYSKAWWDKLKSGCAVYGVFWDNEKLHGLGDVSIRSMDVLNLFWEPGVTDIQESEHFFCTELVPNNHLVRRWPELEGKLGRGGAQVSRYLFDDKATFNRLFKDEVNRDWIELSDELSLEDWKAFLDRNDDLICKPLEGSSGVGIERHTKEEWRGREEAFLQELREKKIGIVEERVIQHPKMAEMCPTSVNTIRIATLLGDKKQGIVYAFLRIGNGKVMDNVDQGGMAARIDLESGTLLTVGADKQGNTYTEHPMTHTPIIGFQIPYFKEACDMCLKAAQKVPQMRFVAWDVAITEKGPVFIEGNSFPSHAIPQFAAHFPDGIGILPRFEEFIDL